MVSLTSNQRIGWLRGSGDLGKPVRGDWKRPRWNGILIQEFLMIGDPDLNRQQAFGSAYDQTKEPGSFSGEAHLYFAQKYSDLAKLLIETCVLPILS